MRKERGIIMIHPSYVELMKVVNDNVYIFFHHIIKKKSVSETIINRSRKTIRRKGKDFTGDIG